LPPENLTPPQASAWANLRLRFVKNLDDLHDLVKAADAYSLGLFTRKKGLPVGEFSLAPTGSLRYFVDDERVSTTPFYRLADDLRFA
jgi:hypothetical protein